MNQYMRAREKESAKGLKNTERPPSLMFLPTLPNTWETDSNVAVFQLILTPPFQVSMNIYNIP